MKKSVSLSGIPWTDTHKEEALRGAEAIWAPLAIRKLSGKTKYSLGRFTGTEMPSTEMVRRFIRWWVPMERREGAISQNKQIMKCGGGI